MVVDRLVVHQGRHPALQGLDRTFDAGVVTGLLCPAGGGTTTLLGSVLGVRDIETVLLGGPQLLVLDEPTVGLDSALRESL